MPDSLRPHELQPTRLHCPQAFPGQGYWSGLPFPSQGIFPTQGLNSGLLHCRQILYSLSHQERLRTLEQVACSFSRGVFPTQESNQGLLHCRRILYQLNYQGSPFPSFSSAQFSRSVSCPTLCNPMNCSMRGLPVHHQLLEFTQTRVYRVSDAIQPSHPLSSPSPPAPQSLPA